MKGAASTRRVGPRRGPSVCFTPLPALAQTATANRPQFQKTAAMSVSLVKPAQAGRLKLRSTLSSACYMKVTIVDRISASPQQWTFTVKATDTLMRVLRSLRGITTLPQPPRGRFLVLKRLKGPILWKHTMMMRMTIYRHINLQLTTARGPGW